MAIQLSNALFMVGWARRRREDCRREGCWRWMWGGGGRGYRGVCISREFIYRAVRLSVDEFLVLAVVADRHTPRSDSRLLRGRGCSAPPIQSLQFTDKSPRPNPPLSTASESISFLPPNSYFAVVRTTPVARLGASPFGLDMAPTHHPSQV
jgi:hypothetical protein